MSARMHVTGVKIELKMVIRTVIRREKRRKSYTIKSFTFQINKFHIILLTAATNLIVVTSQQFFD